MGRRFVNYFLNKGDLVYCVDSLSPLTGFIDPRQSDWISGNPLDFKNFNFVHEDCRFFFNDNHDNDFDYAIHLAALVGGREVIEKMPIAVAQDLSIDADFWSWATKCKPKKVICFSSSASYPVKFQTVDNFKLLSEEMINFEKDIGVPDLTYGWAKLTCEFLGKIAYERNGIESVTYRPFSGYGEDQHENYPFPSLIKRALNNNDKNLFEVWGSGDQMRDFIHIEDCVNGVMMTCDKINDGSAINLSTGEFTSFKKLAKYICNKIGYDPDVIGKSTKPEGVFARGGCTKKQKMHGFEFSISLNSGIEKALNYINN